MSSRASLHACWVDHDIGEADAHLKLKERFRGISDRIVQWHYFDCSDQFNDFINNNPNVKLVAIMSGRLAKSYVTPMADRDALHSVYVFCGNSQKYESLPRDEQKIKAVFTSEDDLFQRMKSDLQREFP